MKTPKLLLLACALAIRTFGEQASPTAPSVTVPVISVAEATVSAPFVVKDGAISQPSQTELGEGGKAVFRFSVAKAGRYVIHAVVNAPDEDTNSFFLNIDAQPEDPLMIWDVAVTSGFEERVVSWRGSGDSSSDEFAPKIFELTAGEHTLNLVGREPAFLKSVSIRPHAK